MILQRMKRTALCVLLTGGMIHAFGGCSLRNVGAGLLSEFLTGGSNSTLGSLLSSGLDELLNAGNTGSETETGIGTEAEAG